MSSSIGGIDLILETSREGFDLKLLLDAVEEYWPQGVFQQADGKEVRPLSEILAEEGALTAREFFLYEDAPAAQSWIQEGQTADNGNSMLHFLIGDEPARPDFLQITLVIDELTPAMAELYGSLSASLHARGSAGQNQKKPARRILFDAELRATGCRLTRAEFYDLADDTRLALYPDWTPEELACHPHDAQQFCAIVRLKANAPVPDNLIMKAMLSWRKRKQV